MADIKNSLVEQIEELKVRQAQLVPAVEKFNTDVKNMDLLLHRLVDRVLSEYDLENYVVIYTSVSLGSMGRSWRPTLTLSYIRGGVTQSGYFWVYIDGTWVCSTATDIQIDANQLDFNKKLTHVNLEHLKAACDEITVKTGLEIQITNRSILVKTTEE